jgi:hypothetical protein
MPRYRKKPVEIEARRFSAAGPHEVVDWIKAGGGRARIVDTFLEVDNPVSVIRIETLEGEMTASPGDWVIRGVKGEFYPCKPDIFEATYDVVETVDV